ncbi:DMT family transporter [Cohnella soli]|uniref:DMT family transporter n=1 Tax=Cohnella soli TaxID=425005 RepID=A0ABW0I217_9BACL
MSKSRTVYLLALLYALIIGFAFLFTKLALDYADPIDTLAWRFTIAFIGLAIPIRAGWIKLDRRGGSWWRIIPIGLLYPAAFFAFQAWGLTYTASSEAAIFQATAPIFTLIMASMILKESTSMGQKLSVLISVGGVVFIVVMSGGSVHGTSITGIILIIVSVFALSLYGVLARWYRNDFSPMQMSYVMMLMGCILFDALALGKHASAGTLDKLWEPMTNPVFVASLLYIGLISSLLSSIMSNYLLSKIEAYKMSMFTNLGTFVSILAGIIFLNEKLAYYHLIGCAFIVFGVFGAIGVIPFPGRNKRRTEVKPT